MRYLPALILPAVCALLIALTYTVAPHFADASAPSGKRAPRAVGLFDAISAPSRLRYLRPRQSVTFAYGRAGNNCRRTRHHRAGFFSDVSAYTWRGGSLRPQRWIDSHTVIAWPSQDGGRVTFDGITFRNRTPSPVLVAGWCER